MQPPIGEDDQPGMPRTVLVTGATGFIGSRLVSALLERGHRVRAMTRRPQEYCGPEAVEVVGADAQIPADLARALAGVDTAVYLVHSLGSDDFVDRDARAATLFGEAAAAADVAQIVYLGGLGAQDEHLSPHLASRREVEGLLGAAGVPVTVLRAGIVVGHGGISWELTRQLVAHLPAMIVPKWVMTRSQPIAADDVVSYVPGVVAHPGALGRVFEIGGPDQLSYLQMLQATARIVRGHGLVILQTPFLTPRLSSRWLALVTDVDVTTGANLIDSMSTEVLVTDDSIREIVPLDPMPYAAAVRQAIAERDAASAQRE